MENTRFLTLFIVLVSFPYFSYAYKAETTHHGLTRDIVRFYEKFYPNTFTDEEKLLIERGAVEEDNGARALNHFFDPVHNEAIVPTAATSKEWAADTRRQANSSVKYLATLGNVANAYFSSPDDYSWERAIYEYVHGDKGRGLESLGHILHLVEDTTVPDHTRGDRHPDFIGNNILGQESPYEIFTGSFTADNIQVSDLLIREGKRPILFSSLGEYFDTLTRYSNSNFFSQNTISEQTNKETSFINRIAGSVVDAGFYDGKYPSPFVQVSIVLQGDQKIGYFNGHPVVVFYEIFSKQSVVPERKFFLNDEYHIILPSYWDLLSREAVVYGAGVIKLFFDEVEEEKQTLALYNKNKSWLGRAVEGVANALAFNGRGVEQSGVNLAGVAAAIPDETTSAENTETVETPVAEEPAEQVDSNTVVTDTPGDVVDVQIVETSEPIEVPQEVSVPEGAVEAAPPQNTLPYPGFGGGGAPAAVASDTEAPAAPVITTPASFSSTSTSASISFAGTAESGSTVAIAYASGGATTTATVVATGGAWSFSSVSLPQGVAAVAFTATDGAGNTSSITWATIAVDSTAPTFSSFSVTECSDSLSVTGCLTTATTLNLSWNSSATDITEYRVTKDYATISTQTATTGTAALSNGTYSLAIVAVDTAGNISTSTAQSVEIAGLPVVLNEIAWSGTGASIGDEWVELFNPTSKSINLSGWTVYAGDSTPYIPLSGTIAAGGYFLIERDDDTAVGGVTANLIFAPHDLSDGGEHMYLARFSSGATTTIDSRTAACGSSWCGGTSSTRYSMERYGNTQSELAANEWGSTLGEFIMNGTDVSGNPIKGTPGQKNSLSYQLAKTNTLTANKTILAAHSPYYVGREGFTVNAGTTLTVEPGVVIKVVSANAPSIIVNGALVTDGTSGSPVIITAFADDAYGGDMNGDGSATTPAAGSWRHLLFNSTGSGSSLTNTIIRYGGRWFDGMLNKAAVIALNTSPTFNSVTVEYSMKHGLILSNATSTITNSTFRYNTYDSLSYGVTVGGGALTMSGSTISNNSYGISVSGATATLSTMTFSANTYYDITGSNSPTVTCTNCGTPTTSPANLLQ